MKYNSRNFRYYDKYFKKKVNFPDSKWYYRGMRKKLGTETYVFISTSVYCTLWLNIFFMLNSVMWSRQEYS